VVTAAWAEPDPSRLGAFPAAGRLRLVGASTDREGTGGTHLRPVDDRTNLHPGRSRLTIEARRRRTLLATMIVLLVALALPLSGTGGYSHATGSALAETGHPVDYTVRPGDTLWSIATRVDPSADPRPLVARLAAQTGSESVFPGERIVLP
jgi:nucleoid-associated protein YgaU